MANPKTLTDLQFEYYAILKSLATNQRDTSVYDVNAWGFEDAVNKLAALNKQAEDLGIPFKGVLASSTPVELLREDRDSSSSDDSYY